MTHLTNATFIDLHYHAAPDLYARRYSAIEAGRLYKSLHGAVVLRSHLGSTAVQATLAQEEGLPVFPSVVLNKIAGGIDYRVVMRALAEYQGEEKVRLLVDFPTQTGRGYKSKVTRELCFPNLKDVAFEPETLFDESLQLKQSAVDILKMARDWPIVLSTGHASKEEVYAFLEACEKFNVPKVLLNQPANPQTGLFQSELMAIHSDKVYVEQTALTAVVGHQSEQDFYGVLKNVHNVIYSSDFGQTSQMDVHDWLTFSNDAFERAQLSEERRAAVAKFNPTALLSY